MEINRVHQQPTRSFDSLLGLEIMNYSKNILMNDFTSRLKAGKLSKSTNKQGVEVFDNVRSKCIKVAMQALDARCRIIVICCAVVLFPKLNLFYGGQ